MATPLSSLRPQLGSPLLKPPASPLSQCLCSETGPPPEESLGRSVTGLPWWHCQNPVHRVARIAAGQPLGARGGAPALPPAPRRRPGCSCSAPSPLPFSFTPLSFLLLPRPHLFIFPPCRDAPQPALLAAQVSPEGGVRKESAEVVLASLESRLLFGTCLEPGTKAEV